METEKKDIKKRRLLNDGKLKVVSFKGDTETPLIEIFKKPPRFLKARDVRRGMSKLISEYCNGNIQNDDAKTLTHMFSTYIQILTATEMEERIKALEENTK